MTTASLLHVHCVLVCYDGGVERQIKTFCFCFYFFFAGCPECSFRYNSCAVRSPNLEPLAVQLVQLLYCARVQFCDGRNEGEGGGRVDQRPNRKSRSSYRCVASITGQTQTKLAFVGFFHFFGWWPTEPRCGGCWNDPRTSPKSWYSLLRCSLL